jgi:hypothetical protein
VTNSDELELKRRLAILEAGLPEAAVPAEVERILADSRANLDEAQDAVAVASENVRDVAELRDSLVAEEQRVQGLRDRAVKRSDIERYEEMLKRIRGLIAACDQR